MGDIVMTEAAWAKVTLLLRQAAAKRKGTGKQTNPDSKWPGSCVLTDMGNMNPKFAGHSAVPGRVLNSATGHYVDIFTVKPHPEGSYEFSHAKLMEKRPKSAIA